MRKSIYIRLIEFGLNKPKGFTLSEILNDKKLNIKSNEDIHLVRNYVERAYKNECFYGSSYSNQETLYICIKKGSNYDDDSSKYTINLDAHFKYYDYEELKEARRMAGEARLASSRAHKISMWALGISIFSIILSVIVAFFITQTIKIDQTQYKEIKNLIENKK